MKCLQWFHDTSLGFQNGVYEFLKDSHDISLGFLWGFHDISIGFLCHCYGVTMGFLLDSCGISMRCLWYFYGIARGFLWCFYEIILNFKNDFYELSIVFACSNHVGAMVFALKSWFWTPCSHKTLWIPVCWTIFGANITPPWGAPFLEQKSLPHEGLFCFLFSGFGFA